MKKYLLILFASLCLGIVSCEQKEEGKAISYDPTVLISNYGLQSVSLLDVADLPQESYVYVECAGSFDGDVWVSLTYDEASLEAYNAANNTSYKALPADCYKLDAQSKILSEKQAEFVLTYDIEKICALANVYDYSDIMDYVVPLVIESKTAGLEAETLDGVNCIFVNPKMTHKIVETFHIVGGDEVVETADAFTVTYKVSTTEAENKWYSGYTFSVNVKNGAGEELTPGKDYDFTCLSEKETFEPGTSEIVYKVSFSKDSELPAPYEEWTVVAKLEGVEEGFIVAGNATASVKFQLAYNVFDRSGINQESTDWASMCNSMPNDGSSPYKLLDGDPNTHWEAAWNVNHAVVTALKPPYYVIFEFKEEVEIAGLSFLRRDAWRGDLKEGYIEYSVDRTNWTKAAEFDYPNDNQLGPFYLGHKPTKAKYIKLWLTNSYRNNGAACGFSELNLYTLDFKVE